jgi:hypothetical protein
MIFSWNLAFVSSRSDPSLFIRRTPQEATYVLIYVDDILFTSSLPQGTTSLLHSLCTKFAIKDLDLLHFFLGMEATTTPARLILSQQPYILDLLHKSNMTDTKPVKTPMSTAHALSLLSVTPSLNQSPTVALLAPYSIPHLS